MAYTPPAGNDVDLNFTTGSYSAPTGTDVDFNFTESSGFKSFFIQRAPVLGSGVY